MKNFNLEKSWLEVLKDEFEKDYFNDLFRFINDQYGSKIIFPKRENLFRAFDLTPFNKVKVVIIGQDPYHGENQANGLAFSVNDGIKLPPSLKNIYKEILSDIGGEMPENGDLSIWAEQGVLLINSVLTVESGKAGSHQKKGWEKFTDRVIEELSERKEGLVFLLWGNYAKNKGEFINRDKHLVLETTHPSPFSAYNGFLGCRHFSQVNSYLQKNGQNTIEWFK